MKLMIKNGKVIGYYADHLDISPVAGALIVQWDKAPPRPKVEIIDGIEVETELPDDPRDGEEKLKDVKLEKLAEIREWDSAIRLSGVSIGPYSLRYDDIGQQRVMNLITSIRELVEQGVVTADTIITFEDSSGTMRKVKASVLRSAVSTYFSACQQQDDALGTLMGLLKAASNIQEVEAIIVG
jgi:hypothetical protein